MKRRQETGYIDTAILLRDGFLAHCSVYFSINVHFMMFTHFSNLLDLQTKCRLSILGFLEYRKSSSSSFGPSSKQVQQIVNSWQKITAPDVVVSAFNQVGIYIIEVSKGVFTVRASAEYFSLSI